MKNLIPKVVWYLLSALISLNAFFVRGLVVNIENTSQKVTEIDKKLAVLETKMIDLKRTIQRGYRDLDEISHSPQRSPRGASLPISSSRGREGHSRKVWPPMVCSKE